MAQKHQAPYVLNLNEDRFRCPVKRRQYPPNKIDKNSYPPIPTGGNETKLEDPLNLKEKPEPKENPKDVSTF